MSKKILGLDLGVGSIGWALIEEFETTATILGIGTRIIPLTTDERDEFTKGNAISKNQQRTVKRTQRKGYDRYQLRRKYLTEALMNQGMLDASLFPLPQFKLWEIRAKAATEHVSLQELGRILYHLNQKRGYKSARSEANMDKKDTEYVAQVKGRFEELQDLGLTIGQRFYQELLKNPHYRIKQQVYPREAYVQEFDRIMAKQREYYPEILSETFISKLRDEIIYYQRKLKSQKGLVSVCEFEGRYRKTPDGKELFVGPRVAPRSSPLFQVCKIWESINSISLKNKKGEQLIISLDKKKKIFKYLNEHERLSQSELFKILEIKREDGWYGNKMTDRGIQGNLTRTAIQEAVQSMDFDTSLFKFDLTINLSDTEVYLYDRQTGEVKDSNQAKFVDARLEREPFYQLWHTIYSIPEVEQCAAALQHRFGISPEAATALANLDFSRSGFGNKSVKAIRKMLPYLMEGFLYSDAASLAGYNHSNSLTKDENARRKLLDALPLLARNSLRQPVVEKILNQMINLVNAILERYGRPDEIRVELARELKQSKDERNAAYSSMQKNERLNESIRKNLSNDYRLAASRNNVIKWKLFEEIKDGVGQVNATCIYCGRQFGFTDALSGRSVDVEHIIPKSLLFDDSQSNKTLSHRACNEAKGNMTAFDYMKSKGEKELDAYLERVDKLFKDKIIGKAKRDKLLMPKEKIPQDFIERQLRQSQYIARKAKEILEQVVHNVWSTGGAVTAHLRHLWGWDDILMNLHIPEYRQLGLTEEIEVIAENGTRQSKEIIKGWSKRDDHRHHAIDALVIACTKQGFIQRINTLSAKHNRDIMYSEVNQKNPEALHSKNLLDAYLILQRPIDTHTVQQEVSKILISYKAGKRVATYGVRKVKKGGKSQIVQSKIIVPRGPLSEESVYGKIRIIEAKKPLKYLFEHPELIAKESVKAKIEERLSQFENNIQLAYKSIKKNPIWHNEARKQKLEYAPCYKEEVVIKYPLSSVKVKDVPFIVDSKVKELVKTRFDSVNDEKSAFKEPLYYNEKLKNEIRSVRIFTGLSNLESKNAYKKVINGFGLVKPGNNHHLAIYKDSNGDYFPHLCSFWHAVDRKKFSIPIIIKDSSKVWNAILNGPKNFDGSNCFLEKLPKDSWEFITSYQLNEMVVIGMDELSFINNIKSKSIDIVSRYLYRVQKISISNKGAIDLWFRHHLQSKLSDTAESKSLKEFYRLNSIKSLLEIGSFHIKIDRLGNCSIDQN